MTVSFKPEVTTDGISWAGNALRFATELEAQRYVADLAWRWWAVRDTRVAPCDEPVTHRWTEAGCERLAPSPAPIHS